MKQQSAKRAARRAKSPKALAPEPLLVDEEEPEDLRGSNDTLANAQLIPAFGSASDRRPAARILGTLAPSAEPERLRREVGGQRVDPAGGRDRPERERQLDPDGRDDRRRAARLGRGQEGRLRLLRGARGVGGPAARRRHRHAGRQRSRLARLPLRRRGERVAANDDEDSGRVRQPARATCSRPTATTTCRSRASRTSSDDPQDSGSGDGADSEGDYTVTFGLDTVDVDTYAVNLRAGDVLGGSVSGSGDELTVNDPQGGRSTGRSRMPPASTRPARRCRAAATRWWTTSPRATGSTTSPWSVARALRRHARGLPAGAAEGGRRPDAVPRLRRPAHEHGHLRRSGRAGSSRRCRPSSAAGASRRRSTTRCRTASSTRSRRT